MNVSPNAVECGNVEVNWSGGSPPYDLVLASVNTLSVLGAGPFTQNETFLGIPETSFSFQIRFPVDSFVLVHLTDSDGTVATNATAVGNDDDSDPTLFVSQGSSQSCLINGSGTTSIFSASATSTTTSSSSTARAPGSTTSRYTPSTRRAGLSPGRIAAIVIGATIGVIILVLLLYVLMRRRRKQVYFEDGNGGRNFDI